MLPLWLSSSLANFMNSPFNHIWSWYGPFWLLILVAILNFRGSYRKRIIVGLLMIPRLTTIVTLDGLRVFGLVVLPSLLVCCRWIIKGFDDNFENLKKFIGLFLLLWTLTPTSSGGGYLWGYLSDVARNEFQQLSSLAIEIGQRFN